MKLAMMLFSFFPAHVFFQTCPEAENGLNCDSVHFLSSYYGRIALFSGLRLGYRNGGQCGIRQDVFGLRLLKSGSTRNVVYSCTGGANTSYCSNNNRFRISYQGRDKYNFQIVLMNISNSDRGLYILEVNISYPSELQGLEVRSSIITQTFYVGIYSSMYYDRLIYIFFIF